MPFTLRARIVRARVAESLEPRANLYSLAATAAGVSMLALVQPADAKVVITNQNIPISGSLSLDLNHDGVPDLRFDKFNGEGTLSNMSVGGYPGAGIVEKGGYASALLRSAKIGPSAHFGSNSGKRFFLIEQANCAGSSSFVTCSFDGKWGGNHPNRFLGIKFLINGKTHFGWVRVTVSTPVTIGGMTATITEYGYETIPNKRVLAGLASNSMSANKAQNLDEKVGGASLGMLALGAEGLQIWRREETQIHSERVA